MVLHQRRRMYRGGKNGNMTVLTKWGRPKGPIKATDLLTRKVLETIDATTLDDRWIAERAGLGVNDISNWRRGKTIPSAMRLSWVLEAIGAEIEIRDKNA